MANPVTDAGMPTSPLVDPTGNIRPAWRALLLSLFQRTGGAVGKVTPDVDAIQGEIDAEEAARTAADAGLQSAINAEAAARTAADADLAPKASPSLTGTVGINAVTLGTGAGVPLGVQPSGSLWLRTDGVVGARLYVSQGGGAWLAVAGV